MSSTPETPQQRRERYLRLAEEAEASVKTVRDYDVRFAQGWRDLAASINSTNKAPQSGQRWRQLRKLFHRRDNPPPAQAMRGRSHTVGNSDSRAVAVGWTYRPPHRGALGRLNSYILSC